MARFLPDLDNTSQGGLVMIRVFSAILIAFLSLPAAAGDTLPTLDQILERFANLRTVYEYRQQLQQVWSRKATSQEGLLQALQDWCRDAEATGIQALQDFARNMSRYSLQTA